MAPESFYFYPPICQAGEKLCTVRWEYYRFEQAVRLWLGCLALGTVYYIGPQRVYYTGQSGYRIQRPGQVNWHKYLLDIYTSIRPLVIQISISHKRDTHVPKTPPNTSTYETPLYMIHMHPEYTSTGIRSTYTFLSGDFDGPYMYGFVKHL